MAASPDGGSVFTGTGFSCEGLDDERCEAPGAVGAFDRAHATGALTYGSCIACVPAADLGVVGGMAVSPDSNSLYVASSAICDVSTCHGVNALARFQRDQDSGALTYRGCVTGDESAGPSGSGSCSEIPSATFDGSGSGLAGPASVAVSPDGRSVYVASAPDASVAMFARNPVTGSLAYGGCITGSTSAGSAGSGACAEIPSATPGDGAGSGLDNLSSVTVSADGKSVYTAAAADAAVARFARDSSTGALQYRGCMTGIQHASPSGPVDCESIPDATRSWHVSPLGGAASLVMSPDGSSLYVGGVQTSTVVQFDRNLSNGALTYRDCTTGSKRLGDLCALMPAPTLDGLQSLAMSPEGRSLYAGGGAVVTRFARDTATGDLDLSSCVSGYLPRRPRHPVCFVLRHATADGYDSGLGGISSLVVSCSQGRRCSIREGAKRSSVYAGAFGDSAVSTLALAPQTKIRKGPKGRTHEHRAVFDFEATKVSTFKCKLTGRNVKSRLRRWRRCGSTGLRGGGTKRYPHLAKGKKVFRVKARDYAHTTDPTPAKRRWRIR
jgi:DNA-binding beta-propeller fold protein YncE